MNTHAFRPPTSPQFSTRIQLQSPSMFDQVSPIREILTNRASFTRNSTRAIPQLISTKTQPSLDSNPQTMGSAIHILTQLKHKYDHALDSQIDTVLSILRTQIFDKENHNPNTELKSQILSLQQSNEKLQNQLLLKKQDQNNESIIINLKQEMEKLQLKLLNKEQQVLSLQQQSQTNQPYEMLYNQQRQKINELEELIKQLKQVNDVDNNNIRIQDYQDLKWRFEQSIIAYQRKDKDLQQKTQETKQMKQYIDQLVKKNQQLEIKLLEIMECEVKQRIIR